MTIFEDAINTQDGGVRYLCHRCGAMFSRKQDYFAHMEDPDAHRKFKRPEPEKIRRRLNVEDWINSHGAGMRKPLSVALATISSGSFSSPRRGITVYTCPFPDRDEFETQDEFEEHLVKAHGEILESYVAGKMGIVGKGYYGEEQKKKAIDKIMEQNKHTILSKSGEKKEYYICPQHKSIKGSYDKVFQHFLKHNEGSLLEMSGEEVSPKEESVNYIIRNNHFKLPNGATYYRCPIDGMKSRELEQFREHLLRDHSPEKLHSASYYQHDLYR